MHSNRRLYVETLRCVIKFEQFNRFGLNIRNSRGRGTGAASMNHGLDIIRPATEESFYGAICAVSHPPIETELTSGVHGPLPIKYTLHPSLYSHINLGKKLPHWLLSLTVAQT